MRKTKEQIEEEIREKIKIEINEELEKKKKRNDCIYSIFDTILMLSLTTMGILLAKYIPEFRNGNEINFVIPNLARLLIAIFLSMGVMGASEAKGGNVEGKKKNLLRRCWFAVSNGLGWYTLLGF